MRESEILRYTIHHSAAARGTNILKYFCNFYFRHSSSNQIFDFDLVKVNARQSTVLLTVQPNGIFPLSGTFDVVDEIRQCSFVRSEPVVNKPR